MTTFHKTQQLLLHRFALSEEELFPEQSLQRLGIDSLAAIELMFDLQDEFGIDAPYGQHKSRTLRDLVAVIDAQLALKYASATRRRHPLQGTRGGRSSHGSIDWHEPPSQLFRRTTEIRMTELLFLPWRHLSRPERICLGVLALALAAWVAMPTIAQDPRYHLFADQRHWLGTARAADVLSNAAFVLVGMFGVAGLVSIRRQRFPCATEAGLWCVALGFLCTGAGSAWYHLNPNDGTLVWDRLPMTLVFTGTLGTALAQRVGQDVARVALALLFELGVASVVYWHVTGDLSLYLTLQFGGIGALVLLLLSTRRGDDPYPWWWLIGCYAFAKVFEAGDDTIWQATHGLLAGHSLKHLAAAAAGAVLLMPLHARSCASHA